MSIGKNSTGKDVPPADISDYEDIIDLPRSTSTSHPAMSRDDRAAQFAPYATLSGHRDEVRRDEDWAEEN